MPVYPALFPLGIFPGEAPFGVTVIPAIFGVVALTLGGLIALTPVDLQRRLQAWHEQGKGGRLSRAFGRFASVPATASAGIRGAIAHTRHPDRALAGAAVYWATQIGVLWASFHAFGAPPTIARTRWMLGFQVRFVAMWEWLTLLP